LVATRLANEPACILKEGTAWTRGREAQNASTIAARIVVKTVKGRLGCEGHGKT